MDIPCNAWSGDATEAGLMFPTIRCKYDRCANSARLAEFEPRQLIDEGERPWWQRTDTYRRVAHNPKAPLPDGWHMIYPAFDTLGNTPAFVCSARCMRLYAQAAVRAEVQEAEARQQYEAARRRAIVKAAEAAPDDPEAQARREALRRTTAAGALG